MGIWKQEIKTKGEREMANVCLGQDLTSTRETSEADNALWCYVRRGLTCAKGDGQHPGLDPLDASSTLPTAGTKMSLDIAKCPAGDKVVPQLRTNDF